MGGKKGFAFLWKTSFPKQDPIIQLFLDQNKVLQDNLTKINPTRDHIEEFLSSELLFFQESWYCSLDLLQLKASDTKYQKTTKQITKQQRSTF